MHGVLRPCSLQCQRFVGHLQPEATSSSILEMHTHETARRGTIGRRLVFVVLSCLQCFNTLGTGVRAATPPSELFSSIIAQKVSQVASNFSSPALYPEYTDDSGKWMYFQADTWTTGFFPAMLYALNTRASLCSEGGLNETDWLGEARRWSTPEVALETNNTQGHDVGFLSYPFQAEIVM